MYIILKTKINKVQKISKLIGIYKLNGKNFYIYQILSKDIHRFIHNKYNKSLISSAENVMIYLQKLKENNYD